MANREEIKKAKRHFENPALLELIRSGVLAVSYEHALTLLDALTAAEEVLKLNMKANADYIDRIEERNYQLAEDRRELMEALGKLTMECERNHRTVYIGWSHDKYELTYDSRYTNPVKSALDTLDKIKSREADR